MAMQLSDRIIDRVCLIDDKAEVRKSYQYLVEDLALAANDVVGPISDFNSLIKTFNAQSDAVICDFNLTTANYAKKNGDWLVSSLYQKHIPAVLCTRWAGSGLPEEVRFKRRYIPVILRPNELDLDSIRIGFNLCTEEFSGKFSKARKPWRTLIRIEAAEENGPQHARLAMVVPTWDPNIGLSFVVPSKHAVLGGIAKRVMQGEIVRAFGHVNLGADSDTDIYIDDWALA